jgi:predicted DCC family thiol-disulfide oxidoreductase YuxK
MERAAVLYDRDCGLCTWSAERLRAWDGPRERLRFVPLQSPEADELLGSMDHDRRYASWHVAADGELRSAGAAAVPVLRRLRGGAPLAWLVERLPRTTELAYRAVTARRGRLGALLGREACAVDPSRPRGS